MFQYSNCIGGIFSLPSSITYRNRFQYFNCIGGILLFQIKKQQNLRVSILQLYRWNVLGIFPLSIISFVSILQLYRWNTALLLQKMIFQKFQYSNCIGGIKHKKLQVNVLNGFNTPIVSVEYFIFIIQKNYKKFQYSNCIGGIENAN